MTMRGEWPEWIHRIFLTVIGRTPNYPIHFGCLLTDLRFGPIQHWRYYLRVH